MNEDDVEYFSIFFAIPTLDINFWTHKNEVPQVNYLCYLTQPLITRQISFELTDIEYDQIKD